MKTKTVLSTLIAASILGASVTANAALLQLDGLTRGLNTTIKYNGNVETVWTGAVQARIDGNATHVYCVDIPRVSYVPGSYSVNATSTNLLANGARAAYVLNRWDAALDYPPSMGGEDAAMQLALWDIVYDNGDGFDTGIFQVVAAPTVATSLGKYFLKNSVNKADVATYLQAVDHGPNNNLNQNMITTATVTEAVPEPASIAVLGIGIAAFLRRRKSA